MNKNEILKSLNELTEIVKKSREFEHSAKKTPLVDLDTRIIDLTVRDLIEILSTSMPVVINQEAFKRRTIITGVPALSKELSISETTLHEWKAKGYLDGSFSQIDRTILFDLDKVLECLDNKPNRKLKRGRPSRR